jgi:APA family basic amino acid/polyamine antiporter
LENNTSNNSGDGGRFVRSLTLLDGILLVAGSMIGSGIFIVSADISRQLGSSGWLIAVWLLSGFITLAAALSYGELSGMYPKAGGQYVYLREAFGKLYGFLYGWSFFAVIQTGTIAAVGVAFGKFLGYLIPALGDDNVLLTTSYHVPALGNDYVLHTTEIGFKIKASQLVGIATIFLLTFINTRGVKSSKWLQFLFTLAKLSAMAALIFAGFIIFKDGSIWQMNWTNAWSAVTTTKVGDVITQRKPLRPCHYGPAVRGYGRRAFLQRCMEQCHLHRG